MQSALASPKGKVVHIDSDVKDSGRRTKYTCHEKAILYELWSVLSTFHGEIMMTFRGFGIVRPDVKEILIFYFFWLAAIFAIASWSAASAVGISCSLAI